MRCKTRIPFSAAHLRIHLSIKYPPSLSVDILLADDSMFSQSERGRGVGVCLGGYVNAAKRGHTREISQKTKDTFHTVDGGGRSTARGGLQDDGNDVKMLSRPWPRLGEKGEFFG